MRVWRASFALLLQVTLLGHLGGGVQLYLAPENSSSIETTAKPDPPPMCRDKFGLLAEEQFRVRSCVLCYAFLNLKPLVTRYPYLYLVHLNSSNAPQAIMSPEGRNEAVMKQVCDTLNADQCNNWRGCCEDGNACCTHQLEAKSATPKGYCPRTWDGFNCWDDAQAGETATANCPPFMENSIVTRNALKKCNVNATWYRLGGLPWTDFRQCLDMETYIKTTYIGLGFSVASIVLLVPAIIIFLCYRDLLRQHRVRLHINFFISLIIAGISNILWFVLVHHDVLTNAVTSERVLIKNPVWCRVLSFFKVYLTNTTYFWMMCEGYYLHRLISNAFEPPKSLIPLYLAGWGLPAIHSITWGVIRGILANNKCWALSFGRVQWVIWAPNLFCLCVNFIFLANILRILLFQLHSHPHEPSNFRRALKAAFMLVPLFGLQIFLVMYRPKTNAPGSTAYEYITNIVQYSQGIFVSLIFCFFNGEVLQHLTNTFPCLRRCCGCRKTRGYVSHTQVTTIDKSPSLSLRSRSSVKNSPHGGRLLMNGDTELTLVGESRSRTNSNTSISRKGSSSPSKRGEYTAVPS